MNQRVRRLFVKYLNNTCNQEEFEEVFDYINSQGVAFSDEMIRSIYDQDIMDKRRVRTMLLRVAASVLFAGIAIAVVVSTRLNGAHPVPDSAVLNSVSTQTARSENRFIQLPDGTQVWLNAASSLEFPEQFTGVERKVNLTGEAFFDVKHADSVPFIITTGKVSTRVVGTAFNIKAYPDQERVTVSVKRGKVNVSYSDNRVAVLERGQQVSIETKTTQVKQKTIREEETSAWQEGNLLFDDETVGDILAYLEKVYDVTVQLDDVSQKNLHISTSFKRAEGIEKALMVISRLTDTEMRIEKGIYMLKNKL
jgi:transmembrane sensor